MTQPKTSLGWTPPSESFLTVCRQGYAEASKNLENVSTAPTRWIAAVSAAEVISRGAAEARRMSAKFAKKWKAVTEFAKRT